MVMLVDNGEGKIVYSDDGDEWRGKKGGVRLFCEEERRDRARTKGKWHMKKVLFAPLKRPTEKENKNNIIKTLLYKKNIHHTFYFNNSP